MRLHQLKIEFDAGQDRLLMRVSTASSQEALLWLTRRCVLRLWPLLVGVAEAEPQIAARAWDPMTKRALFEFQHEKALSQQPVDPMDGLGFGVGADLKRFVVVHRLNTLGVVRYFGHSAVDLRLM